MKKAPQGQPLHNAFTMIELIFVVIVLGILSAIALPKFASTKRSADIASGRADISVIRAAIVSERQTQLVKGVNTYIPNLSANTTTLFTGSGTIPAKAKDQNRMLLLYGIKAGTGSGNWAVTNAAKKTYTYTVDEVATTFDYNSSTGIFACKADEDNCNALVD
ncbi:type II secretion system protein [Sulfurimonas sp.]|uniref:type II secretion system protein n=1 Tax=Sulfurimonas sp. TaxID=2022749 RepID=UPI002B4AA726|nr:type II secretion system protein [Sulfurimonas sp.]